MQWVFDGSVMEIHLLLLREHMRWRRTTTSASQLFSQKICKFALFDFSIAYISFPDWRSLPSSSRMLAATQSSPMEPRVTPMWRWETFLTWSFKYYKSINSIVHSRFTELLSSLKTASTPPRASMLLRASRMHFFVFFPQWCCFVQYRPQFRCISWTISWSMAKWTSYWNRDKVHHRSHR